MKTGDYVRLPDGIHKIKDYEYRPEYENCHCMYLDDNDYGLLFTDKELIKHSPNIIDLIEEHDILKIEEQKGVYTICEVEIFREPYEEYTFLGVRLDNRPIARKLYELNIKSIVTKEQFESMEYKVKE